MHKIAFIYILFYLLTINCISVATAQESLNSPDSLAVNALPSDTASWGVIEIIVNDKINKLVKRHIAICDSLDEPLKGYRIQIYFGSGPGSRDKASKEKAKFMKKYPAVPSYLPYTAPNFKVRVGDFRSKLEAQKFHKEVRKDFPNAFIVKDDIALPRLN